MEQAIHIINCQEARLRSACSRTQKELRLYNRIQEVRLIRAHSGTQEKLSNTSKRPEIKDTPRYRKVKLQEKVDPAITRASRSVLARKDYLDLLHKTSIFMVLKLNWINGFEIVMEFRISYLRASWMMDFDFYE